MIENNNIKNGSNRKKLYGSTIEWYMQVADHYGTLNRSDFLSIARVNRTTFERWLKNESQPPAATVELLRLHAFGEPPSGFSKAWRGFRFVRDKLITDDERSLTPADLKAVFYWQKMAYTYMHEKNMTYADMHAPIAHLIG